MIVPAGSCSSPQRPHFSRAGILCVALGALLLVLRANGEEPAEVPRESPLTAADRDHWAYRPIRRPPLPAVVNEGWCRTPIDQFIVARLEAAGLAPRHEADHATLLRRVTFDLSGLPPTPDEIDRFAADDGPAAYEEVVDRLLSSPAYGERWAQHWLDLARFAETDGFEHDLERPNAWRYRDWVIDALNRDLPYDQFVAQQLAGDEVLPGDAAAAVATGFLLCGPDMPDINLPQERRSNFLNDLTGTIGAVLLGLQVGCAQCHDHKYDPISQFDFYRLRAVFDPVEIFKDHPLPGHTPQYRSDAERALAAELTGHESQLRAVEEAARTRLKNENPDLQPTREQLVAALTDEERRVYEEHEAAITRLRKEVQPPQITAGRIVLETSPAGPPGRLLIRGDFRREGPEVEPAYPRIACSAATALQPPPAGAASTTRRSQLAQWLFQESHPLTARVIVNRVWQFHFGRGLVETASDFGKLGAEPTHPELLDWLADEFRRLDWSLKRLHRLIVNSSVYRQASRPRSEIDGDPVARSKHANPTEKDPENLLLWQMPRLRLEGEALRDAMLAAAGTLNAARGGPGVRPPLPDELVATLLPKQWIVTTEASDHFRRSVYLFVRRNLRFPLFEAFDRPDTNASCPRRNRSTIAPQALTLLNSELSLDAGRGMAGRLIRQHPRDARARVELAWRLALGRAPGPHEMERAVDFLEAQARRTREAGRPRETLALPEALPDECDAYAAAALVDLCLGLFNLNEFVYLD